VDLGGDRRPPGHARQPGPADAARRRCAGSPRRPPAAPATGATAAQPPRFPVRRPRHRRCPSRARRHPTRASRQHCRPLPHPLTQPLLHALYNDLGLSTRHIELLTGQPFEQILDALHVASIPVRHLAGRSPWLTRQAV